MSQFLYDQFPGRYKPTVEEMYRGEFEVEHDTTIMYLILLVAHSATLYSMLYLTIYISIYHGHHIFLSLSLLKSKMIHFLT